MRKIRTLSDCCRRKESGICRGLSLSASQFACLLSFPEKEDAGVVRMAQRLGLSPSRASRIVDSLVRRDFIARESSNDDRRRETLKLTKKGLDARHSIDAELDDCERRLRRAVGAARMRELDQGLARLIEAFSGR